jgi:hypothetical protein
MAQQSAAVAGEQAQQRPCSCAPAARRLELPAAYLHTCMLFRSALSASQPQARQQAARRGPRACIEQERGVRRGSAHACGVRGGGLQASSRHGRPLASLGQGSSLCSPLAPWPPPPPPPPPAPPGVTPVGRPRCPGARAAPPVLAPGLGLGCMPVMGGRGPVCVAPAGPLRRPLARRGGCCLRPACAAGASEGACMASGARASRRPCGTSPGAPVKHTACTVSAGGQAGGAPHAGALA